LKSFDTQAKQRNLTFLNECGLDPGIDHIATLRLKDEIQAKGGKILSYQSYCGALFAPEYLEANPFGYKFSWSPIGVLKALRNNVIFLRENQNVNIPQKDVLHSASSFPGNDILRLNVYPNRNSVPYKSIYGLADCNTVLRGTIRYRGFCEIMAGFNDLGLLTDDQVPLGTDTWPKVIQYFVQKSNSMSNLKDFEQVKQVIFDEFEVSKLSQIVDFERLMHIFTGHRNFKNMDYKQSLERLRIIFEGMNFLNMLNDDCKISPDIIKKPIIEILCEKMKEKLSAGPSDRDLVIMVHYFEVSYPNKPRGQVFK
jgi:saccharopine dehydrogenase-like NADP-dependent oxidoreductase